jgi:hypothetical protein
LLITEGSTTTANVDIAVCLTSQVWGPSHVAKLLSFLRLQDGVFGGEGDRGYNHYGGEDFIKARISLPLLSGNARWHHLMALELLEL